MPSGVMDPLTPTIAGSEPLRLPYGPLLRRALRPVQRAFRPLNALIAPALDVGLGVFVSNPVTGYLMLLRTRGRRTGRTLSTPVAYVILDGAMYCCAGFGERTDWYRNLVAHDAVEVVLPGRTLIGLARPVTDDDEWVRAYRALMASLGIVSRLALGDLRRLDDATLRRTHRALPLVRITPTGLRIGPCDPGGRFWLVALAGWIALWTLLAAARRGHRVTLGAAR